MTSDKKTKTQAEIVADMRDAARSIVLPLDKDLNFLNKRFTDMKKDVEESKDNDVMGKMEAAGGALMLCAVSAGLRQALHDAKNILMAAGWAEKSEFINPETGLTYGASEET